MIYILSIIFYFTASQSQDDWKFKKEKYGAKSYTAKVEGSKYVKYRVEGKMTGTLSSVVAVMQDIDAYYALFDDTKKVAEIKAEGERHRIFYMITNAPWPARDRAACFENNYSYDHDQKILKITGECVNTGYIQEKRVIQLPGCGGFWQFQQIGANKIAVQYQFWADPGGIVPAWLINKKIVDGPLYTFNQIQNHINLTKYQNQRFDFLTLPKRMDLLPGDQEKEHKRNLKF